jgi:hypothetical protein
VPIPDNIVTSQSVMVVKRKTGITTLYCLRDFKNLFRYARKKILPWVQRMLSNQLRQIWNNTDFFDSIFEILPKRYTQFATCFFETCKCITATTSCFTTSRAVDLTGNIGDAQGNIGDAHKIIIFYFWISFSCKTFAICSPRFTEILTDGCETPSFFDSSVALKSIFLIAQ